MTREDLRPRAETILRDLCALIYPASPGHDVVVYAAGDGPWSARWRWAARVAEGRVVGAQTGIRAVDDQIAGFFGGDLAVVAADQSRGKTAFALQCARSVAESGRAVLVFSYEMPRTRVLHRLAQHRCGIGEQRVRAGQLGAVEMNAYGRAVADAGPADDLAVLGLGRLAAVTSLWCDPGAHPCVVAAMERRRRASVQRRRARAHDCSRGAARDGS